jgi:peptidoglycan/LPS O-acetylase OafA/YrhL/lysophospholipase L1-like esterase
MPEPVRSGQRYLPGLDGLRALAVLAVVAYHLGLSWAPGGLLGVGVFFTLSGYLITDLLLGQKEETGRVQMIDFWLRRGRRLLPALFVMLVIVIGWVALFDQAQLPALRGAVAAAVGYVSNWWLIGQHSSYFARFGPAAPLGHLWSLAVEEQFYLVWPWLVYLGLRFSRTRRPASGEYYGLATAAVVLAAASAVGMALLYHPGYDPNRVYDGTDTRAFALLIGAALAFVWPSRKLRADIGALSGWCLDGVGVVGLVVIGALIWHTTEYSAFLYRGGLVVLSLATVLVIAAAASPACRIGAVLGVAPARWIGVRSYGIYLWHYPIIVLTTPASGQETIARGTLQVAASIGMAALSWRYVEEPVRHGAVGRWRAQVRSGTRRRHAAGRLGKGRPRWSRPGWAALAGGAGVLSLAGVCLAGIIPPASSWTRARPAAQPVASRPGGDRVQVIPAAGGQGGSARPVVGGSSPVVGGSGPGRRLRTSCQSVVHIGDSTSDGLVSAEYLPNPKQRLSAQYARRGVRKVTWEISGGRSIVETLDGQANAHAVARQLIQGGYQGCWVLALGTNDTADVYVGGVVGVSARIAQMMSVIGNQPVMWVDVKSLLSGGPYSETDMQEWNQALLRACARYPNMRVYDWAAVARPRWFINDGIHYTSAGYAARSRLIARALAEAFPAVSTGQSGAGCVVR